MLDNYNTDISAVLYGHNLLEGQEGRGEPMPMEFMKDCFSDVKEKFKKAFIARFTGDNTVMHV